MIDNYRRIHQQGGFTFIELAIIISLVATLIVGVIIAQGYFRSAQITSVIEQTQRFRVAVNAFRVKQKQWPGDMANAGEIWPEQTENGDGNQKIELTPRREDLYFWRHLWLDGDLNREYSGKLEGEKGIILGKNVPRSSIEAAGFWASHPHTPIYGKVGNFLQVGTNIKTQMRGATLTPEEAHFIDLKMDDGVADMGTVFTINGESKKELDICVSGVSWRDTNSEYITENNDPSCSMIFWFN